MNKEIVEKIITSHNAVSIFIMGLDPHKLTRFMRIFKNGHARIEEYCKTSWMGNALYFSLKHTSLLLQYCLSRGISANYHNKGLAPLLFSAVQHSDECTKMLICAGADLNFRSREVMCYPDYTPLMLAVQRNRVNAITMLLTAGANCRYEFQCEGANLSMHNAMSVIGRPGRYKGINALTLAVLSESSNAYSIIKAYAPDLEVQSEYIFSKYKEVVRIFNRKDKIDIHAYLDPIFGKNDLVSVLYNNLFINNGDRFSNMKEAAMHMFNEIYSFIFCCCKIQFSPQGEIPVLPDELLHLIIDMRVKQYLKSKHIKIDSKQQFSLNKLFVAIQTNCKDIYICKYFS